MKAAELRSMSVEALENKVKELKAVTAPTSVTLKWTAPSGAKGYKVEQYIKKKWKTVKTIDKAKTTSAKITGLKAKTTYKQTQSSLDATKRCHTV